MRIPCPTRFPTRYEVESFLRKTTYSVRERTYAYYKQISKHPKFLTLSSKIRSYRETIASPTVKAMGKIGPDCLTLDKNKLAWKTALFTAGTGIFSWTTLSLYQGFEDGINWITNDYQYEAGIDEWLKNNIPQALLLSGMIHFGVEWLIAQQKIRKTNIEKYLTTPTPSATLTAKILSEQNWVRELVFRKVNPSKVNSKGQTLLQEAAVLSDFRKLHRLLHSVNCTADGIFTCIDFLIQTRRVKALEYLEKNKTSQFANLTQRQRQILFQHANQTRDHKVIQSIRNLIHPYLVSYSSSEPLTDIEKLKNFLNI